MGKNGSGSMGELQEGRHGEFPGGEVAGDGGDHDGQKSGASSTSGRKDKLGNTSGITDKFHERPGGEIAVVVNKGDGLSK